jgi:hypothetical protein
MQGRSSHVHPSVVRDALFVRFLRDLAGDSSPGSTRLTIQDASRSIEVTQALIEFVVEPDSPDDHSQHKSSQGDQGSHSPNRETEAGRSHYSVLG